MIIMSNNQWKCDSNQPAWAARGEDCSAERRVEGLARAYQQVAPDVLGIQEASVRMNELLMRRMTSFSHEGAPVHYELITGGDTPLLYPRRPAAARRIGLLPLFRTRAGLRGLLQQRRPRSPTPTACSSRGTAGALSRR